MKAVMLTVGLTLFMPTTVMAQVTQAELDYLNDVDRALTERNLNSFVRITQQQKLEFGYGMCNLRRNGQDPIDFIERQSNTARQNGMLPIAVDVFEITSVVQIASAYVYLCPETFR